MSKILITGFSGFVARHFLRYIDTIGKEFQILGIDINEPRFKGDDYDNISTEYRRINLVEKDNLRVVLKDFVPDYILHLAAFSSVAYSWKHPADSFLNNSYIFLNLLEEVRKVNPKCRILSVGSSEEYGKVSEEDLPIRENHPLNPVSPYAVARVSQEQLSKIFADSIGMDIILTRSFNHIGPGQDERFVVPSFIRRILDIKRSGNKSGTIETGNVNIVRDFVDVRDVVRAYYLLLTKGQRGEVYNVCSGNPVKLSRLIEMISNIVGVSITTKINPEFIRPDDNPAIVGSPYKIQTQLGWKPGIPIEKTLEDMICDKN